MEACSVLTIVQAYFALSASLLKVRVRRACQHRVFICGGLRGSSTEAHGHLSETVDRGVVSPWLISMVIAAHLDLVELLVGDLGLRGAPARPLHRCARLCALPAQLLRALLLAGGRRRARPWQRQGSCVGVSSEVHCKDPMTCVAACKAQRHPDSIRLLPNTGGCLSYELPPSKHPSAVLKTKCQDVGVTTCCAGNSRLLWRPACWGAAAAGCPHRRAPPRSAAWCGRRRSSAFARCLATVATCVVQMKILTALPIGSSGQLASRSCLSTTCLKQDRRSAINPRWRWPRFLLECKG